MSNWEKVNLVTVRDKTGMYDLYTCKDCGFQERYYGLERPRRCPRCKNAASESVDIVGCWTSISRVEKSVCPKCKAIMVAVPKEGHPNSKYLHLKRCEDEVLVTCPNGCLEGDVIGRKLPRRLVDE